MGRTIFVIPSPRLRIQAETYFVVSDIPLRVTCCPSAAVQRWNAGSKIAGVVVRESVEWLNNGAVCIGP